MLSLSAFTAEKFNLKERWLHSTKGHFSLTFVSPSSSADFPLQQQRQKRNPSIDHTMI